MDLTPRTATPPGYFAEVWGASDDPWDHGGRWYEARKYALTLAALPRARYGRSFEPGCGAGFLTAGLAERSDAHLAMERHPRGVRATQRRCADQPTVEVVAGEIPGDWPAGHFDLIVLSEVLYYLHGPAVALVLERVADALPPGGDLVAVHHRPVVEAHTWTGDEVHDELLAALDWRRPTRVVDDDFRLDVLTR